MSINTAEFDTVSSAMSCPDGLCWLDWVIIGVTPENHERVWSVVVSPEGFAEPVVKNGVLSWKQTALTKTYCGRVTLNVTMPQGTLKTVLSNDSPTLKIFANVANEQLAIKSTSDGDVQVEGQVVKSLTVDVQSNGGVRVFDGDLTSQISITNDGNGDVYVEGRAGTHTAVIHMASNGKVVLRAGVPVTFDSALNGALELIDPTNVTGSLRLNGGLKVYCSGCSIAVSVSSNGGVAATDVSQCTVVSTYDYVKCVHFKATPADFKISNNVVTNYDAKKKTCILLGRWLIEYCY